MAKQQHDAVRQALQTFNFKQLMDSLVKLGKVNHTHTPQPLTQNERLALLAFKNAWEENNLTRFTSTPVNSQHVKQKEMDEEFKAFFNSSESEKNVVVCDTEDQINPDTFGDNTIVLVGTGNKRTSYFFRKKNKIAFATPTYSVNKSFPFITKNLNAKTPTATVELSEDEIQKLSDIKANHSYFIQKLTSDQRQLAANANLNTSTCMAVESALAYLATIPSVEGSTEPSKLPSVEELDQQACDSISSYKTKRQKALHFTGRVLAGVLAIAFGIIETGTAVLDIAGGLPGIIPHILAFAAGAVSTYITWATFKDYAPSLLNNIVGKDRFTEGLTKHVDAKKGIVEFSRAQKIKLALFSVLAALPTGIAIGALGYTSTLSLPALIGIGASAIFPPIGIAIAAIVAIKMTACLVQTFVGFLREGGDPIQFVLKPFKEVNKVIDASEKLESVTQKRIAKAASYLVTGLLVTIGVVGLAVAAYTCSTSLSKWSSDMIGASAALSASIGIAIGGIASFIGRFAFTVKTAADSTVQFCKGAFAKNPGQVSKKDVVLGIIDIGCVTGFFAANVHAESTLAVAGGLAAGIRQGESTFAHIIHPSDPNKVTKENMKKNRTHQLQKFLGIPVVEVKKDELQEFKKAYLQAYKTSIFKNPASRKKEIEAALTMAEIRKYAENKPKSRTAKVLASIAPAA